MAEAKIITNTSDGIRFFKFNGTDGLKFLQKEYESAAKAICYTPDGLVYAFSDGEKLIVRSDGDDSEIVSIEQPNISRMAISPDAKYLCTYTPFRKTSEHPEGQPNLNLYEVATGKLIESRVHIQMETWRPQWSLDSQLCIRVFQGEIQFFPENKLDEKPSKRLALKGMRHCSLSKSSKNRHLAIYTPCVKSEPATVYIYAWRNGECVAVANKSFFRADTVSLHWSDIGTSLLVLASTKTSDTSYYGDQTLHFLTTAKGGDSASVPMPKGGSIHQVLWRPSIGPTARPSDEQFVVCHGSAPASILVFNIKCEKLYSLGTGAWNKLYFNPQGTLLLAGGFGNLDGNVAVWNYDKRQRLAEFSARNTSTLAWLSDGEHIVTAITTPNLRVDNGWTVWHYTGRPVSHEKVEKRDNPRFATEDLPAATEHELYQVIPRPVSVDKLPPPPKVYATQGATGVGSSKLPSVKMEKPKAYVPPALRNMSATSMQSGNVQHAGVLNRGRLPAVQVVIKDPSAAKAAAAAMRGGGPNGVPANKGGKKNRKRGDGDNQPPVSSAGPTLPNPNQKQINFLKKKLSEIEKLKTLQKTQKLEKSQLEKMAKEESFRKELAELEKL
nr:eukaryotic translation initiation factor 2A [Hymenolepis microstoma]